MPSNNNISNKQNNSSMGEGGGKNYIYSPDGIKFNNGGA